LFEEQEEVVSDKVIKEGKYKRRIWRGWVADADALDLFGKQYLPFKMLHRRRRCRCWNQERSGSSCECLGPTYTKSEREGDVENIKEGLGGQVRYEQSMSRERNKSISNSADKMRMSGESTRG
jgi:hypothetical protein